VCPGLVESDMMQGINGSLPSRRSDRPGRPVDAIASLPMARYARHEEVGQKIAFLPDARRCSTGGTYVVDGWILGPMR